MACAAGSLCNGSPPVPPPQPPTANCQVREAISILDLDVMVYPTPKGGVTWRPKAVELGGKAQVSSAECMGAT